MAVPVWRVHQGTDDCREPTTSHRGQGTNNVRAMSHIFTRLFIKLHVSDWLFPTCSCLLKERVKSVFHAKEFGKIINFKTPEIATVRRQKSPLGENHVSTHVCRLFYHWTRHTWRLEEVVSLHRKESDSLDLLHKHPDSVWGRGLMRLRVLIGHIIVM